MNRLSETIRLSANTDCQHSLQPEEPLFCFEQIAAEYSSSLMRFIYSRVRSLPDAEDICQETFLKAYKGRYSFNGKSSVKSWLFAIAYHEIISFLRKRKLPTCVLLPSISSKIAVSPSETDESFNIWALARQLPDEQYTLLLLRYQEDISIAEIAQILQKSQLNTRVMLHRARRRLSEILQQSRAGSIPSSSGVRTKSGILPCSKKGESNVL
jgi:RNA polymerase sigma-70 factor (ECF subfamily)